MLAVMMEPETIEDVILLEWNFTPKDYFEDEIRIVREAAQAVGHWLLQEDGEGARIPSLAPRGR